MLIVGLTSDDIVSADQVKADQGPLVTALAEAVGALDLPKTPPAASVADCATQLTPDALAGPLGAPADLITVLPSAPLEETSIQESGSTPETGQVMWKYAYEQLGYSSCGILIDGNLVGAVLNAGDAAWVLEDPTAQQAELGPIDGHGDGIRSCEPGGGGSSACSVAYASGDDLLFAQFIVPEGLDGVEIALDTLELL